MFSTDMQSENNDEISPSQELKSSEPKTEDYSFLIWSGILLIFIHVGFSCMEAGRVRIKYTSNVFFKCFSHLFISNVAYWLYGYGLAYHDENPYLGLNWWQDFNQPITSVIFVYNWLSSALPATILSAALGERVNPIAFLISTFLISGALQPIVVHWIWTSNGWLYKLGYTDFAGAGPIFIFAGASCFVSSFIAPSRKSDKFLIHSSQAFGIGTLFTIIGFCALNCGALHRVSEYYINNEKKLCSIVENSILGGSGGCIISLFISALVDTRRKQRMRVILTTVHGAFAGIVAVSGATCYYNPMEALIVGAVGAVICLQLHYLFLYLKVINDPSDGFPIYFGGGLWGVIAGDVFTEKGILFNSDVNDCLKRLIINLVGAMLIFLWSAVWTTFIMIIFKFTKALKHDSENEFKEIQLFNGNQICTEEDYIEALPYIVGDRADQNPRFNGIPRTVNLYENLHTRRDIRSL